MTGKFYKVKCECNNEQNVFSNPANDIYCLVCGKLLVKSKGGHGSFKVKNIVELE